MEFNGIDPVGHAEEPRPPLRNRRFRRGIYVLPSILTVANLLCGYYAILVALDGQARNFDNAALAIGIAWLFDSLDGAVARAMGTNSAFGKEFDSLADIVTFGIAPAVLAYAWGVRAMAAPAAPEAFHLIQLGWLIGFFYVVCCAWRLARFNLQGMAPGGNRYFVGMPTPAGALMVAALVHFHYNPIQDVRLSLLWLLLLVALGVLMSSRMRYYSFKDIHWTRRQPSLTVVVVALLVGAIVYFSRITILTLASAYVLHGVTFQLVRSIRHRHHSTLRQYHRI
jgi:CDP-diacylglycerol--serine O-phosphatidyltransferase